MKIYFQKAIVLVRMIFTFSLAFSFLLMPLNIILFYGFAPVFHHNTIDTSNPFHLTVPLIWVLHLIIGCVAGIQFNPKRYLLTGSMGLFCAFLLTGISILYFSWRVNISTIEIFVPLIFGILPAVKMYNFLHKKFPVKS